MLLHIWWVIVCLITLGKLFYQQFFSFIFFSEFNDKSVSCNLLISLAKLWFMK